MGIVLDLIIRNTVGVPAIFRPGVGTYEFWLKIGIVLLGARFLLGDLAKLGGFSFLLIMIDMVLATTVIILVGHLFGLGGKLSTLLALGLVVVAACSLGLVLLTSGWLTG